MQVTGQRVAILGAGSAGCGIAGLLMAAMIEAGVEPKTAASRFYMVDQDGLLVDGMNAVTSFQKPFLQDRAKVAAWPLEQPGPGTLLDVVRNAKPTTLIGVSGQPGSFSEQIVRAMAQINHRP